MSTESTLPYAARSIDGRPVPILGQNRQISGSQGQLTVTNGLTLLLNHAYGLSGGTIVAVATGSNYNTTYETGTWSGIGTNAGGTSLTGDGSTVFAALAQPVQWFINDSGIPAAASNIGSQAYFTTGMHVGIPGTSSGSYMRAGKIEDFDPVGNRVLVDLSRKNAV